MKTEHTLPSVKPKAALTPEPMSPEIKKLADITVTGLLVHANWFAMIMYSVLRWVVTKGVPVAATDERSIFVNPDDFFKRPLAHRIFILCHEVLHVVLWHCSMGWKWELQGYVLGPDGAKYTYHAKLMNVCMDYIINAMLIACDMEAPPDALYDPNLSKTGMESVVALYIQLYVMHGYDKRPDMKINPVGAGAGKRVDKQTGEVNEDLMAPGSGSPDLVEKDEKNGIDEQARRTEVMSAVANATVASKQAGKLPGALKSLLDQLLEPVVEWPAMLNTVCSRKLGNDAYDWKAIDRRLILRNIGGPRMSEFNCGDIVVASDSSGSITDGLALRFFSETAGVFEQLRPSKIYFIWCDAVIRATHELDDADDLRAIMPLGAPGRGGTDFRPVFDWIDQHDIHPDMLIYLTDGYGSFPTNEPTYDTLWAMITDVKPPFGDIVRIPPSDNK